MFFRVIGWRSRSRGPARDQIFEDEDDDEDENENDGASRLTGDSAP